MYGIFVLIFCGNSDSLIQYFLTDLGLAFVFKFYV